MAKGVRYTKEFKRDAVAQIVDRGYSVRYGALGLASLTLL